MMKVPGKMAENIVMREFHVLKIINSLDGVIKFTFVINSKS